MPVNCPHCTKAIDDVYSKEDLSTKISERINEKNHKITALQMQVAGLDPALQAYLQVDYDRSEKAKPAEQRRDFGDWLLAEDGPRKNPIFQSWFKAAPAAPAAPAAAPPPASTPPAAPAAAPAATPPPTAPAPAPVAVSPPPAAPPPPQVALTPEALRERFRSPAYLSADKEGKARMVAAWRAEAQQQGQRIG